MASSINYRVGRGGGVKIFLTMLTVDKLTLGPDVFVNTKIHGWLGWAMGNFHCRGVLLLLHIVGQGSAVLAAGEGRVGYIVYIFHLSSLSDVLSFGRRLNMTEILWFRLLNPTDTL